MLKRSPTIRAGGSIRPPSVAGSFYPSERRVLASLADGLLAEAEWLSPGADRLTGTPLGLLVPHAGLVYSGVIAAAGWRLLKPTTAFTHANTGPHIDAPPRTVVLLGTNHRATWLDGVAVWEDGAWRTPLGDVAVDADLAREIVDLGPPFLVDHDAHRGEHSIEVQLPLLQTADPTARIVPVSVAAGTGDPAIEAGRRLGELLARRRAAGRSIAVVISSDMAHYPSALASERVTAGLLRPILKLNPSAVASEERAVVGSDTPGLVCGMCGIEPSVLGLAALRAIGAVHGSRQAAATSADAGGPAWRTVGYLAVAFTS